MKPTLCTGKDSQAQRLTNFSTRVEELIPRLGGSQLESLAERRGIGPYDKPTSYLRKCLNCPELFRVFV